MDAKVELSPTDERFVSNTSSVIIYMEDGLIKEYDLEDWTKPLPSFRSLTVRQADGR